MILRSSGTLLYLDLLCKKGLADPAGAWYDAFSAEKHINFIGCLPLRVEEMFGVR